MVQVIDPQVTFRSDTSGTGLGGWVGLFLPVQAKVAVKGPDSAGHKVTWGTRLPAAPAPEGADRHLLRLRARPATVSITDSHAHQRVTFQPRSSSGRSARSELSAP